MHQPGFMSDGVQNILDGLPGNIFTSGQQNTPSIPSSQQPFGVLSSVHEIPDGHPGANGQRYYTIQRVNGNGGNGKGDGVAGPHKHTLEESDAIKKSSVARLKLKQAKEKKKTEVSVDNLEFF